MLKPESILDNGMRRILGNFEIQPAQLIPVRIPNLALINKKKELLSYGILPRWQTTAKRLTNTSTHPESWKNVSNTVYTSSLKIIRIRQDRVQETIYQLINRKTKYKSKNTNPGVGFDFKLTILFCLFYWELIEWSAGWSKNLFQERKLLINLNRSTGSGLLYAVSESRLLFVYKNIFFCGCIWRGFSCTWSYQIQ